MPISNERMNQHIRDTLQGLDLEVKDNTDTAESAVRADTQATQKSLQKHPKGHTMTENQKPTEKLIITDLKATGWVETTIGECQVGEEILINMPYDIPRAVTIYRFEKDLNQVRTRDGKAWPEEIPVLRAPRETERTQV